MAPKTHFSRKTLLVHPLLCLLLKKIRMKRQVMKPFRAPRKTGDKTQVKSSQAKEYSPQKNKQTGQQTISDSEEPTELGLMWPPPAVKDVGEQPSNPWWPQEPSNASRHLPVLRYISMKWMR